MTQQQQPQQGMTTQPQGGQIGQGTTGQQMGGQQMGGQQMGGQQMGGQAGRLPQQHRQTLNAVAEAVEVCGWCADQCIQEANPEMIECIRLCEDVVELGETVLALLPRQSRHGQSILQAFQQAAQACAQECSRHPHSHCQECAQVLGRTAKAIQQFSQAGQKQQIPQ